MAKWSLKIGINGKWQSFHLHAWLPEFSNHFKSICRDFNNQTKRFGVPRMNSTQLFGICCLLLYILQQLSLSMEIPRSDLRGSQESRWVPSRPYLSDVASCLGDKMPEVRRQAKEVGPMGGEKHETHQGAIFRSRWTYASPWWLHNYTQLQVHDFCALWMFLLQIWYIYDTYIEVAMGSMGHIGASWSCWARCAAFLVMFLVIYSI